MLSTLLGFIGGIVAWVATTWVAEPLSSFIQLRRKAARALAEFDDYDVSSQNPATVDWAERRSEAFESIGLDLLAFAGSHQFMATILRSKALWKWRFFPQFAGNELRTLAKCKAGGEYSYSARIRAMKALKIRFSKTDY